MAGSDSKTQKDFMLEIQAEIDKTLQDYRDVIELRQKTLEQDIEQIKVYCDIIQQQPQTSLNPILAGKINRLLAKKSREITDKSSCREKQNELEKRFLSLQEALVGLISKQFKYR